MVRFKHRYLLCEVVCAEPRCRPGLEDRFLVRLVREAVARLHGDFGAAACGIAFTVKYLNAYTGTVLLRCRRDYYQLLWSTLPFITCLENKGQRYPCFFNTLHVGGTIRSCQKFLIQYNSRQLQILLQKCTSEEERESIRKSILSCSLEEEQGQDELSDAGEETAAALEPTAS
ncbi:ribonuclease P/MRP protein subunit POP5 [Tachyglossus aculeatus]|uniref:ribonuclease P/MRP protein subunit POP5 n=1 Tax=Tachyglossus aculeatus TaxID=9261 RepID=UPI0018F45FF6|nr:ribonuclease P/MRP protein subunit POP5 [Tachyglossus aculeatus]